MAEVRSKASPDMLERLAWAEVELKLVAVEVLLSGPGIDAAAAAAGLAQNAPGPAAAVEEPRQQSKKPSRQRSAA